MKSKANQIHLKQAKLNQDMMSIHIKKINFKNIICVIIILARGLMCFHPNIGCLTLRMK